MKKLVVFGILGLSVMSTGCLDFGRQFIARDGTVKKKLPPPIDPRMPAEQQSQPPAAKERTSARPKNATASHSRLTQPAAAQTPTNSAPITAADVAPENPYQALERLQKEIDQDANQNP